MESRHTQNELSYEMDNFGLVFSTLNNQYDQQTALDMMRKYCLQTTNENMQRIGLEFLYLNGYFADLKRLININLSLSNPRNRAWASVYQLNVHRREYGWNVEILKRLRQIKIDDPDLKCVIEFTRASVHFDMKQFGKVGNFLEMQPRLFNNVQDSFMLACFQIRFSQYLFMYHWSRNELIMARKYAFRALTQTFSEPTKAAIHTNLGLTYTFDTYQQGMYHFQEALKLARKHRAQQTIDAIKTYNIPFLSAHFGKPEGITTTDSSEQAHLEIAKGNVAQAIAILENLSMDSPYNLYYMGLAKQDKDLLMQSYNYFIEKQRDLFFARLPLRAMQRLFNDFV
ncbi:AimR family lysis-lysogeny pheromone receptor [Virgibacillus sp. 179-BFC.A HS]|uniref:AimR family lysis-lysogeny pheromone receptor n=1 Tax=Tigheibacillus jepli TaxID=3035914 RepID=A0ABU5CFG1_9BACI|nr:AimR family lysis-lysogeny pheromone receptor [Virgibacillus sp. 179-BFC.A HS]MDY0404579.1 AimR family lysis-lysogeny pheromone receptor [Virgibacillus sp. 179-BFC.A HS]